EDEYQQEIIENMKAMEASTLADASKIDLQPEITWGMRSEIINFMIYVHSNLRLSPNTLFLAINIFDRYCSKRIILLEHRDLVSSTSISIAAKYLEEKRRTPTINQLKKIMGGEFTDFQFAETEIHILSTLGFTVGHPTCESFLDIIFTKDTTITVRHVARYLCEMSFYHRDFLHFTSSMIAYSAKILTLHIFNVQSLNCAENLRLMAANEDFIHCLSLLANHIQKPSAYLHMKYADSSLSHAAQVVEIFVNK
ncbi:cyclin-like protein, partial [Nadsonia fulvescens var. elongata DSM 6958]